jgi:hypothetical protein
MAKVYMFCFVDQHDDGGDRFSVGISQHGNNGLAMLIGFVLAQNVRVWMYERLSPS